MVRNAFNPSTKKPEMILSSRPAMLLKKTLSQEGREEKDSVVLGAPTENIREEGCQIVLGRVGSPPLWLLWFLSLYSNKLPHSPIPSLDQGVARA